MSGDVETGASSDLTINPQNASGNLTYIAVWKVSDEDVNSNIDEARNVLYGFSSKQVMKIKETLASKSADVKELYEAYRGISSSDRAAVKKAVLNGESSAGLSGEVKQVVDGVKEILGQTGISSETSRLKDWWDAYDALPEKVQEAIGDKLFSELADLSERLIPYTISYVLNGGITSTVNPMSYNVLTATFTLTNPTRTGYTFTGWTGTGLTEASTDVMLPAGSTGNREYTANFSTITYTITYQLDGGTNGVGNPTSYTIESATITLNAPTKTGYTFTGWTLNGSPVTAISTGSTGDKVLTANFTPITYTITYQIDGGTNNEANPASYTIESQIIKLNAPTKAGCDFAGWVSGGVAITEIPAGSTGNITLTALWRDTAPVMSSTQYSLVAQEGHPANLSISATGLNLSWDIDGNLPSGLAFTSEGSSSAISGTPEAGTAGTYSLSVTASNNGGSAVADVVITVASADVSSSDIDSADIGNRDIERGDPVTTTSENGSSTTATTTTLKDGSGNIILGAEIAITTESEKFAAVAGEEFSTRINVDVKLDIHNTSYDEYTYLMEIFGLPEWLNADGTLESSGTLENEQHYEFTLSGTPTVSQDERSLVFAATVMISGDTTAVEAYGDKEVMLAVNAERVSEDVLPDVSPDVSPNVMPDVSPDVTPGEDTTPEPQQEPGQEAAPDPQTEPGQDITPEPVKIEDGKITINPTSPAGSNNGTVPNIAEVVNNLTDEEKQSITKLEINSEVQSFEWINELKNLEELTLN